MIVICSVMVEESSPVQLSVYTVLPVIGAVAWPVTADAAPVQLSPLDPVTEQVAFERFQYKRADVPRAISCGRDCKCPDVPAPELLLNVGVATIHNDEPAEQNDGATHVATLETLQLASV